MQRIGAANHHNLVVPGIVVRNLLVPIEAGSHHQRMTDGDFASLRNLEILVLGKIVQDRSIERLDRARVACDSNERGDDALGHGAQIVLCLAREGNDADWLSPAFVLAGKVFFVHEAAIAFDQNRVNVEVRVGANRVGHRLEALDVDSGLRERSRHPAVGKRRRGRVVVRRARPGWRRLKG